MSTVIHCPDCGGVVGATTTTEHGPPCTCFVEPPAPVDPSDGTIVDAPAQETKKICVKCGKDLTGKKRLRDSHGYWCVDCHKADVKEKAPKGAPCTRCARVVPPETLVELDGEKVCSRCLREAKELRKAGSKKFRKLDDSHFERYEKARLMVLLVAAAVLILIAVWGAMR